MFQKRCYCSIPPDSSFFESPFTSPFLYLQCSLNFNPFSIYSIKQKKKKSGPILAESDPNPHNKTLRSGSFQRYWAEFKSIYKSEKVTIDYFLSNLGVLMQRFGSVLSTMEQTPARRRSSHMIFKKNADPDNIIDHRFWRIR